MSVGNPVVGIAMGSDSDLPTMRDAADLLDELHISYEIRIISAHRTPEKMIEYGKTASDRGLKVVIAGAGGAAHLPGMLAAVTTLPVIGVPVKLPQLDGIDSPLSIVQMPKGVPVATVAINNSKNAALLAARIIGIENTAIREQLIELQKRTADEVDLKDLKLQDR